MTNTPMTQVRFLDRWRHFNGETQQVSGASMLFDAISQGVPASEVLTEEAAWARRFSERPPAPPTPPTPAGPPPGEAILNPLAVAHFWQRDNSGGAGDRECFSSSNAMIANFWGKIASDDAFNVVRRRFGDTTDSNAQLQAMRSLGFTSSFLTNGRDGDLEREILAGRPVAVGWLHHGPASRPSGGGHWSVIIGTEGTNWIVHDPFGRPDLVNGGWISQQRNCGISLRFSRANFGRRWAVEGQGSGWYMTHRL